MPSSPYLIMETGHTETSQTQHQNTQNYITKHRNFNTQGLKRIE